MAFSVYHHYTYDRGKKGAVLIGIKDTLEEAQQLIETLYADRFRTGRDMVTINDETGLIQESYAVDYMAQFEALPGKQWHFKSSSSPGKVYTTQINTTGILSCNCKGWTMKKKDQPRHCTHTDQVRAQESLHIEAKGQYLMVVAEHIVKAKKKFAAVDRATAAQQKFAALVADYEAAIAVMAALDPNEMYQAAAAVEVAKFKCESYLLLLEEHGVDGSPAFLAAEAKLEGVKSTARI